jgi:hypothetical protein
MSTQRNISALIGGSVLIAIGVLSLFGQIFTSINFWSFIWPFFIIGVGAMFYVGMFAGGKSVSGLAIPATIITTIGLILFYQNMTGHWESWSYAWTVIILAVGLGIYIMGVFGEDEGQRNSGKNLMKVGAILFVVFGGFFEMIFSIGSKSMLRQSVFPILLILLGLYLIYTRLTKKDSE